MAAKIEFSPRYQELKERIASSVPNFESRVTTAWSEVIDELAKRTALIVKEGTKYIPRVKYSELESLSPELVAEIKQKGGVVIQDVVDDNVAAAWKSSLEEFIEANPDVEGVPAHNKQFFTLYWTQPQLEARAHPNVLAASSWLNNLYKPKDGKPIPGVNLGTSLSYADRFRIRRPGNEPWWNALRPHVDSGGIERWEDEHYRACFADIFNGNWRDHNPYDLVSRLKANSSVYKEKGHATVFRTFQGWLAISELAPNCGTLQVFPDVQLTNAYIFLRPFFSLKPGIDPLSEEALLARSWQFDISSSDFPGIIMGRHGGYIGPFPTPETHPHLRLKKTMVPVPKVLPGDMVFWHSDMIHAVERDHFGTNDAAVIYIGAVPLIPQNADFVFGKQLQAFMRLEAPIDYSGKEGARKSEAHFKGIGSPESIVGDVGRRAMGLVD